VYAIGDLLRTPWLAHGGLDAGVSPSNISREPTRPIDTTSALLHVCWPEVASIGLLRAQGAVKGGYDVRTGVFPFSASTKASILGEPDRLREDRCEAKYDEILGVTS